MLERGATVQLDFEAKSGKFVKGKNEASPRENKKNARLERSRKSPKRNSKSLDCRFDSYTVQSKFQSRLASDRGPKKELGF
jgi:hypothetical protein